MPLSVEVVTGERLVFQADDVDMVIAPGADGTLGILPRHAPLITVLAYGEMRVRRAGGDIYLAVFGGFMEVAYDVVRVLADGAERADEIDTARAHSAQERAEARLAQRPTGLDVERAQKALRRAEIRLRVARRARGGRVEAAA